MRLPHKHCLHWVCSVLCILVLATLALAQQPITFQYFYDELGQLVKVVDSTGVVIEYVYDAVGNSFLVPLLAGSGGGGGQAAGTAAPSLGAGGGAGGGALLIASSTSITVNGTIMANGGSGGNLTGGGGSGGAIRLIATTISGTGTLSASGGGGGNAGSFGRIRLEAFQHQFTGTTNPTRILASPYQIFLPSTPPSSLRVVSVAGVPVASDPTGSFTMPDVTINSAVAVPAAIEAHNIPPGTVVKLHVFSENGPDQIIDSTPLAGTLALSTATASVVLPPGFSRGFVRATWTP